MPALRAHSSSSGGAACLGHTRGQPRGSTPGVREWFSGDLSEKKFLWRMYVLTKVHTPYRLPKIQIRGSDILHKLLSSARRFGCNAYWVTESQTTIFLSYSVCITAKWPCNTEQFEEDIGATYLNFRKAIRGMYFSKTKGFFDLSTLTACHFRTRWSSET